MEPRRWQIRPADPAAVQALQAGLGLPPLLARLLVTRGCSTPEAARDFLAAPLEALHDPGRMAGMAAAVSRLTRAIGAGEPIRVCGDFDADGVCGTALLVEGLRRQGAAVSFRIPRRLADGYGLPLWVVEEAAADGVGVLLTVDLGVSAHGAVERARALGLDVLICDHHLPPPLLPPATAILNPRQPGCDYPFKELCGTAVAAKLLAALAGPGAVHTGTEGLDLVALATVADVVPLVGENRILVKHGLARRGRPERPGLAALAVVAGLKTEGGALSTGQVAFALAPRLNAAGRLGDALPAVRLLLTADPAEAAGLAEGLEECNRERQALEGRILEEAVAQVEGERDPAHPAPALVLASPAWHPGVIGIVAARLAERYGVPAALIAVQGGEGRGSMRTAGGWHVAAGLARCADLLLGFGGHQAAGGFSLAAEQVEPLRVRISALAAETPPEGTPPAGLWMDAEVTLSSLDLALVDALAGLAPHGAGNPEPILAARGLQVMRSPRLVGRNHLKMRVRQPGVDGRVLDSIGFNLGRFVEQLDRPSPPPVDLAFTPERNVWNGRESLQLRVRDLAIPAPE